ncbi:MAG: sensor domain-containing diguanylate cyclase [Pseudomonadota bacterium]
MAEDGAKESESLFAAEERAAQEARGVLQQSPGGDPALRQGFVSLLGHYNKLLKQAQRLVKMGDRSQLELNTLNQRLKESEERYRNIFENMTEGIFQARPDGRLLVANPALAAILGYQGPDELVRAQPLTPPLSRRDWGRLLEVIGQQGFCEGYEATMLKQDGSPIWASISARARLDSRGRLLLLEGLVMDVTQRKRMEEELRHLATTDSLTGLCNRRYFLELGHREFAHARRQDLPLSVLMIDVDHFKLINDNHGHDTGDRVLAALAAALKKTLREHDLCGRLGGEEFAVLLPDTDLELGRHAAERLRQTLALVRVEGRSGELGCTVSLGLACRRRELDSLDSLLEEADRALYIAKQAGRDCVHCAANGLPPRS